MAKTTSVFVSGEARTLSNEEFDVKFNKSIKQLEKGLTKGQRSLKLYYDKNQRLNDALGRWVEGLSLWQRRPGMWVESTRHKEQSSAKPFVSNCLF
jgi:hypothetical protein